MLQQTKIWSDSLCNERTFEREKRMILLKAATLRKRNPENSHFSELQTRENKAYLENLSLIESKPFTKRAYDNYYANVPVETDAHVLEDRVIQLFNEYKKQWGPHSRS